MKVIKNLSLEYLTPIMVSFSSFFPPFKQLFFFFRKSAFLKFNFCAGNMDPRMLFINIKKKLKKLI